MPSRDDFRSATVEALRREVPEELEWIPWRQLPPLHWRDGESVDDVVPRGWLVMAAERGAPEPDDEMRRWAALFDPGDAAALGRWLLESWIEHDTATTDLTPAREAELRGLAERAAEMARRFGRGGTDPEERFQQLLRQEGNRAAPSALPHKGLLAIVAACGTSTAAATVDGYLERWERERPEQSRELRKMVAALGESDSA